MSHMVKDIILALTRSFLILRLIHKFEKAFMVTAVKFWNKIPEEIKLIRNIKQFTTRVKQELLLGNINFPE